MGMSSQILPGILESVLNLIPSTTAGTVAAPLGEQEESVRTAMADGAARILASLAGPTRKPMGYWKNLWTLISAPEAQGDDALASLANGAPSAAHVELGTALLSLVFGQQQASLAEQIGKDTGLGPGSGSRVMGFVAPMVLSWLAREAKSQNLNESTLPMLLGSDAQELLSLAPPTPPAQEAVKGVLPLWPILGVALLIIFVYWLTHYSS